MAFAIFAGLLGSGCDQISARRLIQEGNKHYLKGEYKEATEAYEESFTHRPDLAVGQHNAGLAYKQLFQSGVETPENTEFAKKAAEHFAAYLQFDPTDDKIVRLLTGIWVDSGQYDEALAYWKQELAKDPKNRDVLMMMADINREAGRYDDAIEWHFKRAEIATEDAEKVQAYISVAGLQMGRLNKPDIVDTERLAIADSGLAALQLAEALGPDNMTVHSYYGSVYRSRSLGHGATWAQLVDLAASRQHLTKWQELNKAAKAKSEAEALKAAGQAPKAEKKQ